jgi:CHAT domain-containing protein/predicted negative regulator of RcsB-dependent stress response
MWCGSVHSIRRAGFVALSALVYSSAFALSTIDPDKLLQDAERLAWLKAWTRAAPLYAEAERLFTARGDRRNALYAQINHLRGQLPRLPVPEVSQRFAEYLEDPLVQADERLRLRCMIVKGETDVDLDPALAERSWREALAIAERLGESAWANRARGELGLVAFLQGDVSASIIRLGQAFKVAESNGDMPSVVRWLTLFGHGYAEVGRPAEALDFYDRALKAAATVTDLQFPLMTYLGQGDALAKLGRLAEAEQVLTEALRVAADQHAWGYQAELTLKLAQIAQEQREVERAATLLAQATDLAHRAGGNRILAEIALERGRLLRARSRFTEADRVLAEGVSVARTMQERLLLPRLLAELADLRSSQRRYTEGAALLEEASDLLEGLLTKASSPWVQSRIINGARDLFLARIRLEGARGPNAGRLFAIVEQARGRALLELLLATPVADVKTPAALRAEERRIAELQVQLFRAKSRAERQRLLDQIFVAEEQLAPLSTVVFDRTRRASGRRPVTLRDLQRTLHPNELFLEFTLAEPRSYALIVTSGTAHVESLPARPALQRLIQPLLDKIRAGQDTGSEARGLAAALVDPIRELPAWARIIVSPDGELHHVPFELLIDAAGHRLLETHVVSYVPSGSVLAVLRNRRANTEPTRTALAVSASPDGPALPPNSSAVTRSVYDLDGTQLRPLPSANDEARAVAALLGAWGATVLLGDAATELALKQLPLDEYPVVHFAVHGIPSTRFPARSALLVRPGGGEDGLLQAREILALRLRAGLVTLSACDTGSGSLHEQEGVTSLVRPFLAAGARSVVANLWAADDRFSLSLMREFYRQLADGADISEALRRAKLRMLELFGPEAVPRLWSGVLVYGDGATVIVPRRGTAS